VNTGDAAALLPLVAQYWEFESLSGFRPVEVQAQLERLLSTPALGAAWVATQAQRPFGYLILVYVFSLEHHGLTAEVDELFVVSDHRASGVGSQLLREAEAEAARHGCTNISLQIGTSNRRAKEFYRRHGYSARSGFQLLEKELGAA
jgi:ribosomal protein S18 acetylase RimI-like enzyme